MKLNLQSLRSLPKDVAAPHYARKDLSAGIVHFGMGNFHRAHQAVYLDTLFNAGKSHDWAIIGTGTRAADNAMRQALADQDFLTTIVEQEANSRSARVTAPLLDFVAPGDHATLMPHLCAPSTRIVSLTITEGGYFIDPATGTFNPDFPEIAQDGRNPDQPATAFGLIAKALKLRRAQNIAPFTVMCCDNIPHNGVVTRNAVAGVARLYDKGLADWILDHVAFPNGMVDRITPATTDQQRAELKQIYGIEDNWPVFCEEYIQWVLEDHFCNGRPELEAAGVEFVKDVTPYEFMKIRILNGGHAVLAYAGSLLDVHFVHDAMTHPLISAFFAKVEQEEILPTVPPVPNTNLQDYYKLIWRRFANPKIGDTIPRLAFDGSNRQPKFIVPVARDQLKTGRSIKGLAFESALWCRHCYGTTDSGKVIAANDPIWSRLTELAHKAKAEPLAWLSMDDIYGDVAQSEAFRSAFAAALTAIWTEGVAKALEDYLVS